MKRRTTQISNNVLLAGIGGVVALGGLPPLKAAGYRVIGMDCEDRFAPGRYLADEFFVVPRAVLSEKINSRYYYIRENPEYFRVIDHLLDIYRPLAIIANSDLEVLALAKQRIGLPALLPSFEQLMASHDKLQSYLILSSSCVPLPRMVPSDDIREFESQCHELLNGEKKIIVKQRASAAGKGSIVLDNIEQVMAIRAAFPNHLFFEYLPGEEYAAVFLYRNGECFLEGSFIKHYYNWGQGLRNLSIEDDEVFEVGRTAIHALSGYFHEPPHGTYHVDIRRDTLGQLKVLEINAGRAFGGTPNSYIFFAGGINLPATYVEIVRGREVKFKRLQGGILQMQFHDYVFVEDNKSWTWSKMHSIY